MTGCLATEDERHIFRDVVSKTMALQNLGSMQEVLRILEKVWGRDDLETVTWDVGQCLRCLGHKALLV